MAKESRSNPALSALEVLVGEWTIEISVEGSSLGNGQTIFEWAEGGAFLAQRTASPKAEFPSTVMLIGCDQAQDTYTVLYHDSRGVSRVYRMSLHEGNWQLW